MISLRDRKVLHVGCGPDSAARLHAVFHGRGWREIRLDIDEKVKPDIVGNMVDMRGFVADCEYDAVWSSHNLEHLFAHEAPLALGEFRRALRSDGFALITCPDVRAIARLIVEGNFDRTIYESPAGPICALDMLWGHSRSIARGNHFMAHKTGFTTESLGRLLVSSGFDEAWVFPGAAFDLWAIGLMPEAIRADVRTLLTRNGVRLPDDLD